MTTYLVAINTGLRYRASVIVSRWPTFWRNGFKSQKWLNGRDPTT